MNNLYALILSTESPAGELYVVSVKLFNNPDSAEKARKSYSERGYVAEVILAEMQ